MLQELRLNLPLLKQANLIALQGAGGKAFCAGGDVKALLSGGGQDFFKHEYQLDWELS